MSEDASPPAGSSPEEIRTALEGQKLVLEVEKLQTEIDVLKRPSRHPQLRGAILIAIASLFLTGVQYFRSNQEYILAQIKTERLALDADRLEEKRSALEVVSKALARENTIRRTALAAAETEFRRAQERLTSTELTRNQLNGEIRLLREAVTRAKNATSGTLRVENVPAVASMTVVSQAGTPLKDGDTVLLGDQITISPLSTAPTTSSTSPSGWNHVLDFKVTPAPAKK
jgi:hypothetical protein